MAAHRAAPMSIKETLGTCECKQRTRENTETANFEGVVVPEKEINNGNAFFRKRSEENKRRESGKERDTKRSYYKTGYPDPDARMRIRNQEVIPERKK